MPSHHRLFLLAAACLALSFPVGISAEDTASTVPLASITDARGQLDLHEYRGKVVYLDFWASWCRPCRGSFEWMARMHDLYAPRGLVVLAVNVDRERSAAERFLEKTPPPFRVAFDPEGVLARAHDLEAMPSSFVYGIDGSLQHAHMGFRDGDGDALEDAIAALLPTPDKGVSP